MAQLSPPRPVRAGNGRYEVGELLGRGGMAEVFDGRSLGSHGFEKRVAIKRILPELAGDQTFTSRLVVEAKLAVALQHANIVQVLDLVRDGHDVFLVMEFINGPTLRRLLQERYGSGAGPLPPGVSTYLLHEAAAGLDYAHGQPGGAVIHADISPSNLLLSRNGEVKIADFGIARREGIARAAEGKWGYMAPEQERGEPLSARADLYALGVVFYELLTGVHPFSNRAAHSPRSNEPLISPHVVRPDLPPRLGRLCCEMLDPLEAGRPASAKEVMERIAEIRYQHGWRDGRSELAAAIARAVPESDGPSRPAPPVRSATERTNHPLTLVTRSLLLERGRSPVEPVTPSVSATPSPSSSIVVSEALMALARGNLDLPPAAEPVSLGLGSASDVLEAHESSSATLAFASGGMAPTGWVPGPAPARTPVQAAFALFAPRTWIVLALAALVGVLWGVGSSSRAAQVPMPESGLLAAAQQEPVAIGTPSEPSGPSEPTATPSEPTAPTAPSAPSGGPGPMLPSAAPMEQGPGSGATPPPSGPVPAPPVPAAPPPVDLALPAPPSAGLEAPPGPPVPSPAPSPAPAPVPTAPTAPKGKPVEVGENGTLRVFSDPWAFVFVANQRMETPAHFSLRPGRHVVRLTNPEMGLSRTSVIRIRSKAVTTLTMRLNE